MRNAIRQRLIDSVSELNDVYEPHVAGPDSKMPYAVIMQGEDTEESGWVGFRRIVEVWPYVSQSTFKRVDELVKKVIASLDKQILQTTAGEVFSCMYLGTVGADFVDKEWNGISRGLRFAVIAVQPVSAPETVADDSWLNALGDWTKNLLGQDWDVYRGLWPLGYRRPSIMWRLSGVEVRDATMASFEVRKRIIGHVLDYNSNSQTLVILKVVESLQNDIKIPLNIADRRYMTVVDPRADVQADAITGGQISLTLSRRTNRPSEEMPLMRKVSINEKIK